jgi:hypothetical protein
MLWFRASESRTCEMTLGFFRKLSKNSLWNTCVGGGICVETNQGTFHEAQPMTADAANQEAQGKMSSQPGHTHLTNQSCDLDLA